MDKSKSLESHQGLQLQYFFFLFIIHVLMVQASEFVSLYECTAKEQHSRTRTRSSVSHFGERSSIRMKEEQELEHVTGDSVVMLPLVSESEEEPTLLLLPSRISEDRLGKKEKHFSNMGTWSLCTKLMYCRLC